MDELKRASDFQDRRLLLRRMLELLREADEFMSAREKQFLEKWGEPPQVEAAVAHRRACSRSHGRV
jgi:hypothetical protein